MVNIGTRVGKVKFRFLGQEMRLQLNGTTLSIKLHYFSLSEIKIQVFTLSDVLGCVASHCVDQKQHSNLDFLTKSIDKSLQTCVDIAN